MEGLVTFTERETPVVEPVLFVLRASVVSKVLDATTPRDTAVRDTVDVSPDLVLVVVVFEESDGTMRETDVLEPSFVVVGAPATARDTAAREDVVAPSVTGAVLAFSVVVADDIADGKIRVTPDESAAHPLDAQNRVRKRQVKTFLISRKLYHKHNIKISGN